MTDAIRKCIEAYRASRKRKTGWDSEWADDACVELAALEDEREALREALYDLVSYLGTLGGDDWLCLIEAGRAALAPAPSDMRLVPLDKLREIDDVIVSLLDVQNGCPLPQYQAMFDNANERAHNERKWLASLIGETKG